MVKKKTGQDISKTFCILPWIHLSTRPSGEMRVCCTANASSVGSTQDKKHGGMVGVLKGKDGSPSNFNTTTLKEAWNSDYMKNVRQQMLAGEKPASCLKCFKEEESGYRSKRMWETDFWAQRLELDQLVENTNDDGSVPMYLPYIDLRFGSKCNLRCIMCSPHDSSNWVPDWNKLYPNIKNENLKDTMQWGNKGRNHGATYNWHKNNSEFWNQLYEQIPNMKQLYFAGGEPLIIEEHYTLLEKCIEMGYADKIQLRYNSNGTELPDRLFELWNHFSDVRFHFSLDSIFEMNDYIRYPSKFDELIKNLRILDETPNNIEVTFACAAQALNIYYLPDFIKWKLEQNFKKINIWPLGAGLINTHLVYHPAHLNVKILPKWFKDEISEKYEHFYSYLEHNWQLSGAPDKTTFLNAQYGIKRLQGLVNFMNSEDWSNRMPEFVEYINSMDGIRNTNFRNTFPEMGRLLDEN